MGVNAIPEGYGGAIPYLSISGAGAALDFYERAFNAECIRRMPGPDGRVGHAEMRIQGALIMLADEFPEMGFKSPKSLGGSPVLIHIYVQDVDALAKRAEGAGIKITRALSDQFYGDRTVGMEDPFGHSWYFATHIKDMTDEEMAKASGDCNT